MVLRQYEKLYLYSVCPSKLECDVTVESEKENCHQPFLTKITVRVLPLGVRNMNN